MSQDTWNPLSRLDAFRSAFRADIAADAVRPLAEYLARFPGDDAAITREYRAALSQVAATAPLPSAADLAASRIAHYRILREIGRGGQATVYLAVDTKLHREVALKVLDPGPATNRTALERFRREAEITSKLDHPGICTVYETGEDRGSLWIAMRYIEGDSLAKKISTAKEGQASSGSTSFVVLTEREARDDAQPEPQSDSRSLPKTWAEIARVLGLFEETARTLHVAHEHGVIHRDIKPGNLIVTKEGEPVILDFGLAQEIEGDHPALTVTGDLPGTPAYMSPEQIAARRIRLDGRTDVYSLGVSLYECVTLKRPFDAPTRDGLYQAIMTKDAPDPRELNPAVPDDLKVVLEAALEKDRDRRYQSALDFAEELRRVRMHEPILAKPVGPLLRLRRWSQRNPALAGALIGLFVVLAAGLTTALILLEKSERERIAKERALGELTREHDQRQAALSDYDRLGDLSRLQKLVARAELLWPAEPSKVLAMRAWVDDGSDLKKRVALHEGVRDRLRLSAGLRPCADDDLAAHLEVNVAEKERIDELRAERERVIAQLAAVESAAASGPADSRHGAAAAPAPRATSRPSLSELRTVLSKLDAEISRLEAQIDDCLSWKFESPADQFKHDTTAKLVADLTAFLDPDPKKGLLAEMRTRLAFAESVQQETIGNHETEWAHAIRSIADQAECPKYRGMKVRPQLGLLPIGKDSASGLWEFVHLQTTEAGTDPIPKRDKDGRLVVTESMGLVFVLIPGGAFRMGAIRPDDDTPATDPNVDPDAESNESPVTEVLLDPFFLSKYEMTQGQWLRIVGKNPSQYRPGTNYGGRVADLRNPVEQVSWDDCVPWLRRLGLILPTEAQWEYAARGGTTTPRWTGTEADGLARAANLADAHSRANGGSASWQYESWNDGYAMLAPVGSLAANPFGLHDVLGNVWEWCRDKFADYAVAANPPDGLRRPPASRFRVIRGGCFNNDAVLARSAYRGNGTPEHQNRSLGLRPAKVLEP